MRTGVLLVGEREEEEEGDNRNGQLRYLREEHVVVRVSHTRPSVLSYVL